MPTRIALTLALVLALTGCSSLSSAVDPVSTVTHGMLAPPLNTTTVGKAFEGTFKQPAWKSFATPKGTTVVEFNGSVSIAALHSAGLDFPARGEYNRLYSNLVLKTCSQAAQFSEAARQSPTWWVSDNVQTALASCLVPVRFQFTLSADDKTFTLTYIDEDVFGSVDPAKVLAFIYR
jgi:hypothetical protein